MENNDWIDIKGYEGVYKINRKGDVKSLSREVCKNQFGYPIFTKDKLLSHHINRKGYIYVVLTKDKKPKLVNLHRLIAIHFIPNPENKLQVNHKSGIKTDNRVENLEWCTNLENMRHAYRTGLKSNRGVKNARATLNEKQVRVIKYCMKLGMKNKDIKKYFIISHVTASSIRHGRTWSHVTINN